MKRNRNANKSISITQENSIVEPQINDVSYENHANETNIRMITMDANKSKDSKDVDLSNINDDISKFNESVVKITDIAFNQQHISKLYQKGDVPTAIANYYQNYGVCDQTYQPYSLSSLPSLDIFKPYGEGLQLYFQFMRSMAIIFTLCSLISGFLMYVNFQGGYLTSDTMTTYLDFVALSNMYGFKNVTTDSKAATWVQDNKMWYLLYYYFDFGESIYLILILIVFKFSLRRSSKRLVKERVHPQKFTVEVTGFQEGNSSNPNEFDIQTHFSKFGVVKHVACVRNFSSIFKYFTKADKIYQEVQVQKARNFYHNTGSQAKLQKLNSEYMSLLKKGDLNNKKKLKIEQFPIEAAFITFDTIKDKKTTNKAHNKYNLCRFKGKAPKDIKLFGTQTLNVRAAPDPSVINYANYRENILKETLINIGLWIFLIIWLCFTYLVCFALREYIITSEYNPKCVDTKYLGKSESSYSNTTEKGYVKACFCSQYSSWDLLYGDYTKYKSYCNQYVENIQHYPYVVVAFGGFIFASNLINIIVIHCKTNSLILILVWYKMRTFKDKTSQAKSKLTSVFIINFVNTFVPLLIIHLDLRWTSWVQYLHDHMYHELKGGRNFNTLIFQGYHPDTTRAWIQWINLPICAIIGVQFVFSILLPLIVVLFYKINQTLKKRGCVLQIEFNSLYKGLKFYLEYRYANHVQFACTILLFSGLIPCLVCLLPFYYIIHYYIDYLLMLRIYRVPPRFDSSLSERAIDLLYLGVLLHVTFTLWVFSYPMFFPQVVNNYVKYYNYVKYTYYYVDNMSFFDRVFTRNGIQYFIVLCAGIFIYIFMQPIAFKVVELCCFKKSKRKQGNQQILSYTQEFINFEKRGKKNTIEFDMMNNPKFSRAIDLLNCNNTIDIELQDLHTLRTTPTPEKLVNRTNKISPTKHTY